MAILKRNGSPQPAKPPEVQEYAPGRSIEVVIGEAIEKYCNDAANAIMAKGDEIMTIAESFHAESLALADNIKKCGELQKERATQVVGMVENARRTVTAVSTTFNPGSGISNGNPKYPDVTAGMELELIGPSADTPK